MESDNTLFEEIYDSYATGVKRFIFTQTRCDMHATDDIFQSTWENVYRYLDSLRDKGAAKSWLYSIAKNEAIRYYSRREKKMGLDAVSIEGENFHDLPDEEAEAFTDTIADSDRLADIVGRLSTSEQQLILLHYSYDMSLADIAELLDANYNTVKSVFRRSLAKMRKISATEVNLDEGVFRDDEDEWHGWYTDRKRLGK